MTFLAAELPLCQALNRWSESSVVQGFFATISRFGDGAAWYALMASLALFGGERGALVAGQLALTGLASLAIYRSLKLRIRRPRPCDAGRGIVARVAPLDRFSFPSGHTLHAVAFTVVASAWFPVLAIPLVPFAILVALSRVVLGLHYPSDVAAATAIGLTLAGVSLAAGRLAGLMP